MHLPRAQRYFCRFTIISLPHWSLLPSWLGRARSPFTLSRVSVIVCSSYVATCHFSHPSFQTGIRTRTVPKMMRTMRLTEPAATLTETLVAVGYSDASAVSMAEVSTSSTVPETVIVVDTMDPMDEPGVSGGDGEVGPV